MISYWLSNPNALYHSAEQLTKKNLALETKFKELGIKGCSSNINCAEGKAVGNAVDKNDEEKGD